ncbi:energy transducer TonB [Lysobacter antibioticus]|uniref:energy transducer TonB n=1 Tax=Lysobacter TaxID=68 RepID=UPI00068FBA50|nr:energy transducer TonB [Lysobacter antibioticus]
MSTTPPAPSRRSFDFAAWRPSGKAWLLVLGAFAVGLGLFAWVWSSNRNNSDDFYRADGALPAGTTPQYAPLPAPAGAGGDGVAPSAQQAPQAAAPGQDEERAELVENPNPPAPPQTMPSAPPAAPAASTAAQTPATPLPGNRPPQYPAQALRRGEGGTVRIRVTVDEQGSSGDVQIVEGSGSRLLDRAAVSAVRQWRFRPAMRNGRPVADAVIVPITFNANQ